jgi:hypothetical protein
VNEAFSRGTGAFLAASVLFACDSGSQPSSTANKFIHGATISPGSALDPGAPPMLTPTPSAITAATSTPDLSAAKHGLNVDFNEQAFSNMTQVTSSLSSVGPTLTSDADGWPQQNFEYYIDNRYAFAWVPGAVNIDPLKFSTDLSGTYTLMFTGQAQLASSFGGSTVTFANQTYNSSTNTTTVQVTVPVVPRGVFFGIRFTQTRRQPNDNPGNGVTNIQFIRPGTMAGETFSSAWLHSIKDYGWQVLRFMGAMGINSYAESGSSEAYPYLLQWATDRPLPGNGPLYGKIHRGIHSVPWEEVVIAANQTGKDVWISVPVNASIDYVNQLAQLFHSGNAATASQGLSAQTNIYVEYSNEMWHLGFPQGPWNKQAAVDEVSGGDSNLNYDNINNQDMWRFRRIAKRTIEIGQQFKAVFRDRPDTIRPVIDNSWLGFYPDMLDYVTKNYGPPANYLYGIAQTAYYSSSDATSVSAILNGEMAASDANHASYVQGRAVATYYGLHSLIYEGGEGETGDTSLGYPEIATTPDPTLPNKFAASRDSGMQAVLTHDLLNNWFPSGGELYMHFSQVSHYSTYGFWGLTDDITNLNTPKWLGAGRVLAATIPAARPGTNLPSTVGASVTLPETAPPATNFSLPSDQPWLILLVNAPESGTYMIQFQGQQIVPGNMQVMVDNNLAGATTLPSRSAGTSSPINMSLSAGLHTVFIYGPVGRGPQGVRTSSGSVATIVRTQ